MAEVLTIEEMTSRFDSEWEWVLVEEPEVDDDFNVVRGRIIWHSKDRDEVYQKMLELRPTSPATIYLGAMPADTAFIL